MEVFGQTRSRLRRDHALITPDTHVNSPLVGWQNASAVIHISPEMGARFWQYSALLGENAISDLPATGSERMIYVRDGEVQLEHEGKEDALASGGFAFLPAGYAHAIKTGAGGSASLLVIEKKYSPLGAEKPGPQPIVGNAVKIKGEPFMGDSDAVLQTLLPVTPDYDMAVNVFTYQPVGHYPKSKFIRWSTDWKCSAAWGFIDCRTIITRLPPET